MYTLVYQNNKKYQGGGGPLQWRIYGGEGLGGSNPPAPLAAK